METRMIPSNTVCLWYAGDALDAANFYAATFPDSAVAAVNRAPGDYPSGKEGDVLMVEFTVCGIPCIGRAFGATELFRLQEPGGRIGHAELDFDGTTLMLCDEFPELDIRRPDPASGHGGQSAQASPAWCADPTRSTARSARRAQLRRT